jgi:tRNA A-37 threonylcarbamoyl transferase component Bud32
MELTVPNVYGLLLRSHLLPLEEAKAMYARWQEEAGDGANNTARFASWMVAHKYVTEYQAGLLARGHADGFFLNDYKILDRLGKGRMAGVYKAQHKLGQIVAIKVLPPSKAREPNLLGRFQREARLALRLKHPNIVRTFQTGIANQLHYLVMEYLEGETLEEMMQRRGKLLPAEAARLVYQALQGLQHIHSQELVHRDLKPSNLMLVGSTPDSTLKATLKILDIGLGRTLFEESTVEQAMDAGLTGEGVLLGTPDYMAPEQARDPRSADIRADIYSLGGVLYHLLAGQPPFPDTNIISQMIRHATEPPRPLKELNPAVPDGLQQIVNWMMAKDPAQRYATPERAAQALQVFLSAGAEAAAPAADARMNSFLTWLEEEKGKEAAAPPAIPVAAAVPASSKPPSGVIPVPAATAAVPMPPLPPAAAAQPPKLLQADGARESERRHRKKNRPLPVTGPNPGNVAPTIPVAAVAALPEIDVELVTDLATLAPPGKKILGMRLSRRDFTIFGIGALAGALVVFLGYLLAHAFRN